MMYVAGCENLEEAIADAKPGETVKLIRDVEASEIITIDKAITINGNGNKLTSTAGRAINVDGANGATIKNLTIEAKGERAINVINGATNVTIENVTATAANYAVNLAGSAANAVVTITGSDLTGLAVVNVAAEGAQIAVNNTKLTNVDASASEYYGAITIGYGATNAKVTVTGGEIIVADDSKKAFVFGHGATVEGVDQIGYIVAMIGEAGYDSLEEAIKEAYRLSDGVKFEGAYRRSDIGQKALKALK
jgi:phosphoribosylamine-glycine ligase